MGELTPSWVCAGIWLVILHSLESGYFSATFVQPEANGKHLTVDDVSVDDSRLDIIDGVAVAIYGAWAGAPKHYRCAQREVSRLRAQNGGQDYSYSG